MELITGDNFRRMCKYVYTPDGEYIADLINKDAVANTVYCDTHDLELFMSQHRDQEERVVLVSHNSDGCILPYKFRKCDFVFEEHKIPKCIDMWYAQNMDVLSSRIRPLPIGIENFNWHKGVKYKLINNVQQEDVKRDRWVYCNFEITTNPVSRKMCMGAVKNKGFVTHSKKVDYREYLLEMKRHRFVLCPEGNGFDCHRTWEALYMGAIPIVQKRIFTQMFSRIFPMYVVSAWDEISLESLKEFYENNKATPSPKLDFKYWKNIINNRVILE